MKPHQDDFFEQLQRTVKPDPKRPEPEIWFQELRILNTLSLDKEAERRRITLHRGFNILWAAPEDPDKDQGLYKDGLAGHASGKTLFCRILRHLIGEESFGTETQREEIAKHFLTLWAVASVRVNGKTWIVGRPLSTDGKDFAVEAETIEQALTTEAPEHGYDLFLQQVRSLGECLEPLYPDKGWRHLLPWIARDQESRFSNLAAWREASSQGDNPQTKVSDRHQIMRAVLNLIDLKEPSIRRSLESNQTKLETDRTAHEKTETELAAQRSLANQRTMDMLGDDAPADPDEIQTRLKSLAEVIRERVEELEKRPVSPPVAAAQAKVDELVEKLALAKSEAKSIGEQLPAARSRQDQYLTLIRNLKTGNVEDPTREDAGFCPKTIQFAREHGCVVGGEASEESKTSIADLERQAKTDAALIQTLQDTASQLAQDQPDIEKELQAARSELLKAQRLANQDIADLNRRATRAEEASKLYEAIETTKSKQSKAAADIVTLEEEVEKQKTLVVQLRKEMDTNVTVFSAVFADIVRAVMGATVQAEIAVTGDGIVPRVTRKGELSGAALDTIKTLAFDLAAVVASIEGRGSHPRLLIHDGPREGDMARIIYEHFFLYATSIERVFESPDQASFQYIITTTTPPPKSMREGSRWLLDPILDSRSKDLRLLKEDF